MEKLVYSFWHPGKDVKALRDDLVRNLGPSLKQQAGVHGVQVNITDEFLDVPGGLQPFHRQQPPVQGILNIWVDTSYWRKPLEALIAQHVAGFHGYSVVESKPIVNTRRAAQPGQRLDALSQVVFLEKPEAMDHQAWLSDWLNRHTQVAIDTQSTFGYVQNIVLRPLTPNAPMLHGIIEELFPFEAFTSQHAFYDAVGDDAKLQRHFQAMMDSCASFIDRERMDIIHTSQYVI